MTQNKELLTKEQVYNVIEFAQSLYDVNSGMYGSWNQNANIKNLNNSQLPTDYDKIVKALNDVKNNEELLGSYSQFMETFDTIYGKTIELYCGMLSMNYRISCENWKNVDDFNKTEYEQDKKRFYKFMRRFDYKREFSNVVRQVLRTGRGFYWFRTTEGVINDNPINNDEQIKNLPKYALQLLPQDICVITGRSSDTFLYDIDFNYFLNGAIDINLYPPIFKKKYKEVFNGRNVSYIPSSQYSKRNGVDSTMVQTSPQEGAWCFVWDDSNANALPPFANLMKATFDNTKVHELQMSKDLASAFALIFGEIGTMDGLKSGDKPDQTKFNPKTMGTFMNLVQNSVQSIMKTVALPLEETRFAQFTDQNINMESTALESSAGQGAFGSSLVYNSGKKIQSEVLNGITADYNSIKKLYYQFARFCEYYGNKKTKKYKFHVVFDGCEYPHEREERRDNILRLADKGIVLNESAFACAFGYDPFEFESMLAEASHSNMKDNLMLLLNVNTMKDGSGDIGTPKKSKSELTESGANSQDYDS